MRDEVIKIHAHVIVKCLESEDKGPPQASRVISYI